MSHRGSRNDAFWSVITQLLVIIIFFFPIWIGLNLKAASSFAVGGIICVLPNIYLYRQVFRYFGAKQAKQIVKAFYWGEAAKFVLTAAGFVGALSITWILPLWLFVGYIVTQISFWVAPVTISYMRNKKKIQKN